jgi:hypothetical protein
MEDEGFKHLPTRGQSGGSRRTPQMLRIQRLHPVGGLRIKQPPMSPAPAPDLRSDVWRLAVWRPRFAGRGQKKVPALWVAEGGD